MNKGRALARLKKNDEAIACFDEVLTILPYNADALFNKGVAYAAQEKYEEAILCYNQFLKINPKHVLVLVNKGRALARLKKNDEAIACFDEALTIRPEDADALYNNGAVRAARAAREKHEVILKDTDSLKVIPQNALVLGKKGVEYTALKKHDDAIECFNEVLRINLKTPMLCTIKGLPLPAGKSMKRQFSVLITSSGLIQVTMMH